MGYQMKEQNNFNKPKKQNQTNNYQGKGLKRLLIGLALVIFIPSALAFGYVSYMASKIQRYDINDPIWEKPFASDATGNKTSGANTLSGTETIPDTVPGEVPDGLMEIIPPANTNSLGIAAEVEDTINSFPGAGDNRIRNVLLLGADSNDGSGRSDAMMILTIDSTTNQIKLSSIMRDSYVYIDGYGMDKLNHAYAFGGAKLALQTVNSNFQMNLTDVMVVNFSQIIEIVDTIGGVPIVLSDAEAAHMKMTYGGGSYYLSGAEALAFSRIRYIDDDFQRTGRQRKVLTAILNQIMTLPPTQIAGVANDLLPLVSTTLSSGDIVSTSIGVVTGGYSITGRVFPSEYSSNGIFIGDIWYLQFDRDAQAQELYSFIFNQ